MSDRPLPKWARSRFDWVTGSGSVRVFNPISAVLTDDVLRDMNARAADEPGFEDEIAEEFLREHGFID